MSGKGNANISKKKILEKIFNKKITNFEFNLIKNIIAKF